MKWIGIILTILAVGMGLSFILAVILDKPIWIIIAFYCFVGMLLVCIIWDAIDTRRYRDCDRDICGPEDIL